MPERLGAAYGIKAGRSQDPAQHYQSRPNGPMLRPPSAPLGGLMSGSTGSLNPTLGSPKPGGGFVSHMPTVGGGKPKWRPGVGQGGVGQPGGMQPPGGYPRNGGVPGGQPKQPRSGGPVLGGGGPKGPPRMGGPIGGGTPKQQPGRAPAHYGPIQANTGTGSTKAPLARSLGKGSKGGGGGYAPPQPGLMKGGGGGYAPPQPGLMKPKLPTVGNPRKR